MDVMKIEEIVGDVILVILDNYEPLKKIGIENDKFFVRVKGYDEYGLWIYQPKFPVHKITSNIKNEALQPKYLPMLMPPRKWEYNPFVGGYYGRKHNYENKPEDIKEIK